MFPFGASALSSTCAANAASFNMSRITDHFSLQTSGRINATNEEGADGALTSCSNRAEDNVSRYVKSYRIRRRQAKPDDSWSVIHHVHMEPAPAHIVVDDVVQERELSEDHEQKDQRTDGFSISGDHTMSKFTTSNPGSIISRCREKSERAILHVAAAGCGPELHVVAVPSDDAHSVDYAGGEYKLRDTLECQSYGIFREESNHSHFKQDDGTSGRMANERNAKLPKSNGFAALIKRGGIVWSLASETNFHVIQKREADRRKGTVLHGSDVAPSASGNSFGVHPDSVSQTEIGNGKKKRTCTQITLTADEDARVKEIIDRMYGRRRTNTRGTSQVPASLSEVLPIENNADCDQYIRFYYALLSSGRLQDCVLLLEEMDKVNILDTDKIHHSGFFKACQKQKAVVDAFKFTRLISSPSLSTFNMLLSVCREARDVDSGLRALSAAENLGLKPDAILYTTLISTCAKAGKVDIAFQVYHEMEAAGVVANVQTYGSMIDGCARAGEIAKAFGVYSMMLSKQVKPDLTIFNTLINACSRRGAMERAFDVFAYMKAEPCCLKPDHITYGALISACARADQVERAFEVYRDMRQSGIKGTRECYTAAVHACSQTGDLNLARSVLEEMKADGVQPDEILFSAMIDVAGHANNIDGAFQIVDEMKKYGILPKAITYSAVMRMCSNTGNWERALKLYQEIKESGLELAVSIFNPLITALCDAKQVPLAFGVLDDMRKAGVTPDQITHSIVLEMCET